MKKIEIDKNAEQKSRILINVVHVVTLICCFIILIAGFIVWANLGFIASVPYLIIALIVVLTNALSKVILHTFVNISYKLSYCEEILKTLERIEQHQSTLVAISKETLQVSSHSNANAEEFKKRVIDNDFVNSTTSMFDQEFNRVLIDMINADKELDARSLLINEKNMTFSSAISYIDNLKKMTR
jgi:hypothetical protein